MSIKINLKGRHDANRENHVTRMLSLKKNMHQAVSNSMINCGITLICLAAMVITGCNSHEQQDLSQVLPEVIDFNFHIKPILSDRCFACHGPDVKARKADLRLDDEHFAYSLLDSLKGNYIIRPGDLDKSELYQRIINQNDELKMPPPESNLSLSEYEIKHTHSV